jgi:hypothetical protein
MDDKIIDVKNLDLTMKVWEKTLASQIIPMKDVPKAIEKILTNWCKRNYCKRNIKVKGNGLTEDIIINVGNE